jgi:replicative DNA helicase
MGVRMKYEQNQAKYGEITATDIRNEQIVLGYMLSDEEVAVLGYQMLDSSYFLLPHSAYLFKKISAFIERGDSIANTKIMVDSILDEDWQEIDKKHELNKQSFINNCMAFATPFLGINLAAEGMFNRVKDQYLRREFIAHYAKGYKAMIDTANDNLENIATDSVASFEKTLDSLTSRRESEDYKSLALRILNKKSTEKIASGFKVLDGIIGGFRTGQLVTIGAGTSVGKSAFAINLALNFCDQGEKVALWSFEMDQEEVMHRVFAIKSGISSDNFKNSQVSDEHYNSLIDYIRSTRDDLRIFTHRITDLNGFALECRRLRKKDNVRIIIIDYLQLIHLNRNYENNRVRELETITNKLKSIAAEYGILVIALSQLSRAGSGRGDKTPVLSDLRDSGSIEQDSNLVLFLHKGEDDKVTIIGEKERVIHVVVAKNRNGKIAKCCLRFNGSITKFSDYLD